MAGVGSEQRGFGCHKLESLKGLLPLLSEPWDHATTPNQTGVRAQDSDPCLDESTGESEQLTPYGAFIF